MNQFQWENIASGDREAYSAVYTYYYNCLFNYGRKFTDDEALIEDAIQEVFIILWKNRKKFSTIQSPQSYLFFSFRNRLFYQLKQLNKRSQRESQVEFEPEFNVEHIIIRAEVDSALKQKLQNALKALPARQRETLFLRFYEEMPYEQIAEVMGVSVKATYKSVSKALINLRNTMGISISLLIWLLSH